MVSALRKWWNGDYDARLEDAKARIAAAPDGAWIAVDSDLVLDPPVGDDPQTQKITVDHDIRLMKRAVIAIGESSRTTETGTTCQKCGQTGLAYRHKECVRILVCSHVKRGLELLMARRFEEQFAAQQYHLAMLSFYGATAVGGAKIESIECGRNLYDHLRMRYCWFD